MTSTSTVNNYSSIQNTINNESSGKGSTTDTSATSASSLNSLSSDYTNFINLLTTQLKNQDPTSPVDTTAFTQQLIGFSQIQQQVQTNTNLTSLINQTKTSGVNNAVAYVNQLVDVQTNQVNLKTNKPMPTINYTMSKPSSAVSVSIADSTGKVIRTYTGSGVAGANNIPWDGMDSSGNTAPEGDYTVTVTAKDSDGNDITDISTDVTDYVSQVGYANGTTTLYFGDIAVTTDKVNAIKGYYSQTTLPSSGDSSTGTSTQSTS